MPRNQFWTAQDVASTVGQSGWKQPDGPLTFTANPTTTLTFDAIGSFADTLSVSKGIDYITVNLVAGASYNFIATGTYQVSLSIYDSSGYLLVFTDGDDIGKPDRYPQDSILNFVAEYSGEHRLRVVYSNVNASGTYAVAGSVDYGNNGKNDAIAINIEKAVSTILLGSNVSLATTLASDVYAGSITFDAAISKVVTAADASTSVATLSYQFFTGKIPSSGGVEYLVSPTGPNTNNLNSAYYQSFNLENRYINFAVNLGKVGEGATKFAAEYGSLSLFDATKKAYATIFGGTPTDAKVTTLLSGGRDLYFEAYGKDGLNGIGTKAAMVGWLLAEAEKGDLGVMARSNAAWLLDLSDGSAPFAIDILAPSAGYYKADFIFGG